MGFELGKSMAVQMLDAAVCEKTIQQDSVIFAGIHKEHGQICRCEISVDHMIWAVEEGKDMLGYDEKEDMYFYIGCVTMEEILDEYYEIDEDGDTDDDGNVYHEVKEYDDGSRRDRGDE